MNTSVHKKQIYIAGIIKAIRVFSTFGNPQLRLGDVAHGVFVPTRRKKWVDLTFLFFFFIAEEEQKPLTTKVANLKNVYTGRHGWVASFG